MLSVEKSYDHYRRTRRFTLMYTLFDAALNDKRKLVEVKLFLTVGQKGEVERENAYCMMTPGRKHF